MAKNTVGSYTPPGMRPAQNPGQQAAYDRRAASYAGRRSPAERAAAQRALATPRSPAMARKALTDGQRKFVNRVADEWGAPQGVRNKGPAALATWMRSRDATTAANRRTLKRQIGSLQRIARNTA